MFRKKQNERVHLFEKALLARGKVITDRRKKAVYRIPWGTFSLWTAFSLVSGYTLFFSPGLMITKIEVSGESVIPKEEYRSVSEEELSRVRFGFFRRDNYFLVPKSQIEDRLLARYPKIETLSVERDFPDGINISVTERPVLVLWCSGGPCYEQLGGRALLRESVFDERYAPYRLSVIDASAVPISLGELLPVERYFDAAEYFFIRIPEKLGFQILTTMTTPSRHSNEMKLVTEGGMEMIIPVDRSFETTLGALKIFLEEYAKTNSGHKNLQSIDFRVEGKVFFREKGSREAVEAQEEKPVVGEEKKSEKKERKKEKNGR